ncbi:MAG TPA: helix-turn-helix transcriptional regulator [Clostridiales bacterium]|nr:helix-turn-helix transcriptional regulator [Clostridiales bacterium]
MLQEQLARLLDISLKGYQNIEAGRHVPSIITGLKLAYYLDVDPYILFNVKIDNEQNSK